MPMTDDDIARRIVSALEARDAAASICPSEVARTLLPEGDGWKEVMPAVSSVAATLVRSGTLRITRGDATLDPDALKGGPIRLRRGPRFGMSTAK